MEIAVAVIEGWSKRNGMVLNKSKSGVVIFADGRARKIPKMRLISKNELKKPGDIRKWEIYSRWNQINNFGEINFNSGGISKSQKVQ